MADLNIKQVYDENTLLEVRCPTQLTTKSGYSIECKHLLCIASPGSKIQVKCRHCKETYEVEIPPNAQTVLDIKYKNINPLEK